MDPFMKSALRAWELPTEYDTLSNRYHPNPPGLDCWQSVHRLGKGSFGEVWKERCLSGPSQNAVRAVKHLRKYESIFPHIPTRELLALIAFSDSHKPEYQRYFVQFLGWFEDHQSLYIVMEHIEYGDLQSFITRPFSEAEAAFIVDQIAHALQYMHKKNFVHRDIKPSNILVLSPGPRWHVKVADFGIAKNTDGSTMGTRQIGSSGYMAPELYGDVSEKYTSSIDIWALGAVTFCLLTGFPPFPSVQKLLDYARDYRTPSCLRLLGEMSGFCMSFVSGTMADLPERRLTIEHVIHHDWLSVGSSFASSLAEGTNLVRHSTTVETWSTASNSWSNTNGSSTVQQTANLSNITAKTQREEYGESHRSLNNIDHGFIPITLRAQEQEQPKRIYKEVQSSSQDVAEEGDKTMSNPFAQTGWMKMRKTVSLIVHEWKDYYFTLENTRLTVYENEECGKKFEALEYIDITEYAVKCTTVSNSKLSIGFFRKREVRLPKAYYTFSLVPVSTKTGGATGKFHHFSVKSRDGRIDWMREIMLAKALRQGRGPDEEIKAPDGFF